MDVPALRVEGLTKVYPNGVKALDSVDFDIRPGEVHAVLGENGAGKTTLMRVLAGILQPTAGKIYLDEKEVRFDSPIDALNAGIGMVQQHLALIDRMTALENFILKFGKKEFFIDIKEYEKRIREGLKYFGLDIPIDCPVDFLSASQKQLLEILFLFLRDVKVLILDEPTSTLGGIESKKLLDLMDRFKSEGKSIVFVTHKIHEALRVSDRITVLRRGKKILTDYKENLDEKILVESIMGAYERRGEAEREEMKALKEGPAILTVEKLNALDDMGRHKLKDVSFEIREGEIFGIGGMQGSGQKELVEAITGLRKVVSGRIVLGGREIRSPKDFLNRGGRYIPAERLGMGVCPELSILLNANLRNVALHRNIVDRFGLLSASRMREYAKRIVEFLDVVHPTLTASINSLSGGNIQKLIVGREALEATSLLVAEEPTAGLDIYTTRRTLEALKRLRDIGVSVLLISTELDDLLKTCDRIGILYDGRLVKVFKPGELSISEIGRLMLGGSL